VTVRVFSEGVPSNESPGEATTRRGITRMPGTG
jgi:hypothetical protein